MNKCEMTGVSVNRADIAASFQKAVCDAIVEKMMLALDEYKTDRICLAGGVAANSALRETCRSACEKRGVKLLYPSPVLCTDNGAMIGTAAYYEYMNGRRDGADLNAVPNLKIGAR